MNLLVVKDLEMVQVLQLGRCLPDQRVSTPWKNFSCRTIPQKRLSQTLLIRLGLWHDCEVALLEVCADLLIGFRLEDRYGFGH
jgi:hypothetical protein